MTDELAMLRQFRDSIADISLTVPSGVNGAQWASKKLRELRRTARIYRDQSAPALIDHLESDGGRNLVLLEGWSGAEQECKRVGEETTFADDVSEEQRKGFQSGVSFCIGAIRIASSRIDIPLSALPVLGVGR